MNRFKHLALLVGLAMGSALAAGTAPGTNIANTATASYTDPDSAAQTTSSNTVTTRVSPKGGFSITLDQTSQTTPSTGNDAGIDGTLQKLGSAGQTVVYDYTITNDGNYSDTYTLSTALAANAVTGLTAGNYTYATAPGPDGLYGTGDDVLVPVDGITLAPGASTTFHMVLKVPNSALTTQIAYADPVGKATVTNVPDNSGNNGAAFTVGLAPESNNNFQYNKITINPSAAITATKTAKNVYTTYTVGAANTPAATTYKPKVGDFIEYEITATNGSSTNAASSVTVTDTLPVGTTYTTSSFKASTGSSSNTGSTYTFTPTGGTLAASGTITIDVVVQVTALASTVAPANINNPVVNVATVNYTDPGLGAQTPVPATSGPTNVAGVGIGPIGYPTGAATGSFTATEPAPNATSLQVTRTGTGIANDGTGGPGNDLSTISSAIVNANTTTTDIIFPGTVSNIGTAADTFTFSSTVDKNKTGGTPTVTYYSDSAATVAITDTGSLAAGASFTYYVKLTLPAATPTYTGSAASPAVGLTVTATSGNNASVKDVTTDALLSTDRRSTLVGNNNNTPLDNNGAPDLTKLVQNVTPTGSAQEISYPIDLVNTGATDDTVTPVGSLNIPTVATPGGTPTNITYYLANSDGTRGALITSTVSVPAGQEVTILAVVTVPADALPTATDTGVALNQTFTSTQNGATAFNPNTTTVSALSTGDLLTIGTNNSFTFSPDDSSRITAVGSHIYSHTLTNTSANTTINGGLFTVALDNAYRTSTTPAGSGLTDSGSSLDSGTQSDFVLTYSSTLGGTYTSTLPAISTLAPGASQTLFVKVANTNSNNVGAVNDVVFQAAPTFSVGTATVQFVEDVTLVKSTGTSTDTPPATTDYALKPLKTVKTCADAACATVNDTTGATAKPGDYLQYTLVTTNNRLTAATLNKAFISDTVPTNTTFVSVSATSTQTGTILYSANGGSNWSVTAPTAATLPAVTQISVGVDTATNNSIDTNDGLDTGKTITIIFTVLVN
ncbi:DUF11 domain-containing protein [Deinococcus rubellus]|uniref:DUF11 domain-containing protein n=1 Tax=Deinococcus rubellus TaxID=1889240 RepID=A0ABY5YGF0_9DEIO|nr:hypothetical protein [Deinococcus rubellus]UWX64155.1 hypothetical protein N0D28_00290 [Deinococcus rubellus]